jgi:KaiC/GvpD/RAD55 family RecA-like ATPase
VSIDLDVLSAFSDRDTYQRFSKFVRSSALGEEAHTIFTAMGEWMGFNPMIKEVNWSKFGPWFLLVKYPKLSEDKAKIYRNMFADIAAAGVPAYVEDVIEGLVGRDYAAQAGELLLKIADGDAPVSDLEKASDIIDTYRERKGKIAKLEDSIVNCNITEVLKDTVSGGYNWRMGCLNDAIGPLRQGDFIVVGTRPDTGKTTFLAAESTFIAQQLADDRPVLWLNNEEAGKKVLRRIVQAAIGWTTSKMEADPAGATEEYKKLYGREDKVLVYDNAFISTKDVEALCKKYNPGLIIFDQLWKVKGFNDENEVTRLTMLFNWGREIAKAYAPVITVHQADGTAEGVQWIDMSKLYMSKTGIQGEADAIITMGRLPDKGNARYLHIPKNKMTGTVPSLRNGKFEIEIQPEIARFKEPT